MWPHDADEVTEKWESTCWWQTDPPPFEVRALFEELHKEEAACVEKLGRGALSDGKGGCHCYALEYRMDNGTCVEYKHSSQALPEKEEELG